MTAPYFPNAVSGLLLHAKRQAGIEDEDEQGVRPTPPWNPNYDPTPTMQGLLSQNLSQNPVMGDGPGLLQGGPQGQNLDHDHKKGIGGAFRHLFGADRIDPSVAEILDPDQKRQLLGKSTLGLLFAGGSEEAAQDMVRLRGQAADIQDTRKKRADESTRDADYRRIRAQAEMMPIGPERSEYIARAMAEITQNPVNAMQTAVGLREREFAPRAPRAPVTRSTATGIQQYDFDADEWKPMLDAAGNALQPVPQQGSFSTPSSMVGPNGRPMVMNNRTGRLEEAPEGVSATSGRTAGEIKIVNTERSLAYRDAERSLAALQNADGSFKDPPNYLDRVATQSDWTNWAASGEGQVYMSNTRKLIRAWVVLIEGKRMSDADARINEMMRSFRPGDAELADEDKKATLKDMATSIKALGLDGVNLPLPGEKPRGDGGTPQGGGRITVNGKVFIIPEGR